MFFFTDNNSCHFSTTQNVSKRETSIADLLLVYLTAHGDLNLTGKPYVTCQPTTVFWDDRPVTVFHVQIDSVTRTKKKTLRNTYFFFEVFLFCKEIEMEEISIFH